MPLILAARGIDKANRDLIVRARRPVFEVHLVAQHQAIGGVDLQLVVVTEPVESRSPGDRTNGNLARLRRKQKRGQKQRTPADGAHGLGHSVIPRLNSVA